jgi:hypothetical protein
MFGVFVSALFISASIALHVQILKPSALYERQYHQFLELKLDVDESFAHRLSSAGLCVLVDGMICRCYDSIHAAKLYVTPDCMPADSFWFSVLLYDNSSAYDDREGFRLSNAYHIPALGDSIINSMNKQLTMVLTLTLNDLARAVILIESISYHFPYNVSSCPILELLIIAPNDHVDVLGAVFSGYSSELCFPISVIEESSLFGLTNSDCKRSVDQLASKYALQMAIKLLVSKRIKTTYFITLDADIVMLESFQYNDLIIQAQNNERAIYHREDRFAYHPDWYAGSERTLNLVSMNPESQGFGVTPALLSTYGSLLTLSAISHRFRPFNASNMMPSTITKLSALNAFKQSFHLNPWIQLIRSFGNPDIWTEYTLYRIVLDQLQVS